MKTNLTSTTGNDRFCNDDLHAEGNHVFSLILDTFEQPLFLFDSNFKFAWYNRACDEMYQSVSGKPIDCSFDFNELLTEEQQPIFHEHLKKVLAGEKAHFEWRYKKAVTRWISVSLYPFKTNDEKFVGICGNMRDITEKKINELILLRNTAILNNINDAVIYTDYEQNIAYFNKTAEKLYGLVSHEVMGRRLSEVIGYDYVNEPKEYAEQCISATGSWEGKVIYRTKHGKKIFLLASVAPLTDKHDNKIGFIATYKDITEEELSKQQSQQHQDYINGIISNIKEGVLLIDHDFTILAHNERAYNLEKKICTNLKVGENLVNLLPECRKKPVIEYLELSLKDKPVEYEVLYPDNTWLLIYFVPVKNKDGEIKQICITYRDITERKKSEDLIKANEKKYRTIVNSLSEGVILQTRDNRILTANKSAAQILGATVNELKQNGFFSSCSIIVDEAENKISAEDLFSWKSNKPGYLKNKVIGLKRCNHIQWLKLNSATMPASYNNELEAIVISFEDITEQKKISGELKVLSMVAKETDNSVCILLPDGEVQWVNEGFTRFTGYRPEEIIGTKSRPMFIGPGTDMNVFTRMVHQRQNGLPFKEEVLIYTKSGQEKWAIIQGQPVRDANGKLTRYFSLVTDITKIKKVTQELEVLSMVAKETHNSVIIFDKTAERNTLWVNEGFTRITGYKAEDIIGKNSLAILSGPETDQSMIKYMREQVMNNKSYFVEIFIYAKDGSKRLHQLLGQPIKDHNGNVTKYFAIGTDITEQRRLEEERLQKEVEQQKEITRIVLQTQESERNELGRELHDNINQILGAVKMQLSYSLEADPKTAKQVTQSSIEHLREAMSEIRNLSHRMVMPRFSESSLEDELNDLIHKYNNTKAIQLETRKWREDKIPYTIKEAFFRIAQEQLNNIYKHANADEIIIQLENCKKYAVMRVKDNGVGFDTTMKRKGIGITNIMSRVELMNGISNLVSAPGKGCSLSINIPLMGGD